MFSKTSTTLSKPGPQEVQKGVWFVDLNNKLLITKLVWIQSSLARTRHFTIVKICQNSNQIQYTITTHQKFQRAQPHISLVAFPTPCGRSTEHSTQGIDFQTSVSSTTLRPARIRKVLPLAVSLAAIHAVGFSMSQYFYNSENND